MLSQYVGWGGLADAFDPGKDSWAKEYAELKGLLSEDEYAAARSSTLNAHYTSPTVIKAIYEAVGRMGFETGNILEPSMGVGNFFGMLPDSMAPACGTKSRSRPTAVPTTAIHRKIFFSVPLPIFLHSDAYATTTSFASAASTASF